jgi:hypothetical protein
VAQNLTLAFPSVPGLARPGLASPGVPAPLAVAVTGSLVARRSPARRSRAVSGRPGTALAAPYITAGTGTAGNSGSSTVLTQAVTIPAGLAANSLVLLVAQAIILTATPVTITASSAGTLPAPAVAPVTGSESLPASVTGSVFQFTSSAADAGAVITLTSSAACYWAWALYSWTGSSGAAPAVDVISGAFGGAGSASVTCPVLSTGAAGDWGVCLGGGAAEGGAFGVPPGTARESSYSGSDVGAGITDSGGPVGAAGASIGGGTFTAGSAGNSLLTAFTAGITLPSAAAAAVPFTPPAGGCAWVRSSYY